ncbi:MAG: ATP-binding protein [Clostridia bacterium]|nr:ATP-binding protein [Clostridia bacterium]
MQRLDELITAEQLQALHRQVPALAQLRREYISLCDAHVQALMAGRDGAAEQQARDAFSAAMPEKERAILAQAGIELSSLSVYRCLLCKDSGFVVKQGRKVPCQCAEEKQKERLFRQAQALPSFAAFDKTLFEDADQLASALLLRDRLMAYCRAFGQNERPHFCLTGQTGVGKSFLLGCTVRALMEQGIRTRLLTAYEMMELFRAQHIGEGETLPALIEVPFLAIDDLGTEPMYRNITVEYLFTLIDERVRAGRPMAIATNLMSDQIRDRYGERVLSRLRDTKQFANFGMRGKDLRPSGKKQTK